MNDLDLVRRLRSEVPEQAPTDLHRVEARLHAALSARGFAPRVRAPARRWWPRLLVPVSLAAAVTIAAATAGVLSHPDSVQHRTAPVGPVASSAPSMTPVSAVEVLQRAATAAERDALAVRPNQFIHREVRRVSAVVVPPGPTPADYVRWLRPEVEESWLSADGTRVGLARVRELPPEPYPGQPLPSGIPAPPPGTTAEGDTVICRTGGLPHPPFIISNDHLGWQDPHGTYTYLGTLPTDPERMRRYLYEHAFPGGADVSADERAWVGAAVMLEQFVLPGPQSAALFRALALIPGTTVIDGVVDAVGRPGIAIGYTQQVDVSGGTREELVFDATSYRFLASERVAVDAGRARIPLGSVQYAVAQLGVDVADAAPLAADPRRCR